MKRERRRGGEDDAKGRVQAREAVLAVKRRAALVAQFHAHGVVSGGKVHAQSWAGRETLGDVERGVAGRDGDLGEGVADEDAAWNRQPRLVERAEFGAGVEVHVRGVVDQAEDEAVRPSAGVAGVFRVQPEAAPPLRGAGAVDGRAFERVGSRDRIAAFVLDRLFVEIAPLAVVRVAVSRAQESRREAAGLVVGVVAVVGIDVAAAPIDVATHGEVLGEAVLAHEIDAEQRVAGAIRAREDGLRRHRQKFLRRRAVADQVRVRGDDARIHSGIPVQPAELGEPLGGCGRRIVAPAVFAQRRERPEVAEAGVGGTAGFGTRGLAPERTDGRFEPRAGMGEAVLRVHGKRAAKGVEAEQRIRAWQQRHGVHRGLRNQRPAHRVAEGLVGPNAVQIHRKPLRQPQKRRADEAAVAHIRLQRVALRLVHEHARGVPSKEVRQARRPLGRDVLRRGRQRVAVRIDSAEIEWCHDFHHLDERLRPLFPDRERRRA